MLLPMRWTIRQISKSSKAPAGALFHSAPCRPLLASASCGRHGPFAKTQRRIPGGSARALPGAGRFALRSMPLAFGIGVLRATWPVRKDAKAHPWRLGPRPPWRGTLCSSLHAACFWHRRLAGGMALSLSYSPSFHSAFSSGGARLSGITITISPLCCCVL